MYGEIKIGTVNSQNVFDNSLKGKEIIEKLNSLYQKTNKKIELMRKEVDTLEKEVLSLASNQEMQEKKKLDIQKKKDEINKYAVDAEKESQKFQKEEFENVRKELLFIIEEIAKSDGYSLILEGTKNILFTDQTVSITDISDKVTSAYNVHYSLRKK